MDDDNGIRLNYASKYAGVANYWKNRQGMIDALSKFKTAEAKAKNEAKFDKWSKKKKNSNYSDVVTNINAYYNLTNDKSRHDNYLRLVFRASNFATSSRGLGAQLSKYAAAEPEEREGLKERLRTGITDFFGVLIMSETF